MDRPRRALLVLDLQNEFLDPAIGRCLLPESSSDGDEQPDWLNAIAMVLSRFRQLDGDIIWVRSESSERRDFTNPQVEETIMVVNSDDEESEAELRENGAKGNSAKKPPRIRRPKRRIQRVPSVKAGRVEGASRPPLLTDAYLSIETKHPPVAPGSAAADWCLAAKEMMEAPPDRILTKSWYSAFKETSLLEQLRGRLVTELYVCGLMTNVGVLATVADAVRHGFQVKILIDCLGYRSQTAHERALRHMVEEYDVEEAHSISLMKAGERGERGRKTNTIGSAPVLSDDLVSLIEGLKLNQSGTATEDRSPSVHLNTSSLTSGDCTEKTPLLEPSLFEGIAVPDRVRAEDGGEKGATYYASDPSLEASSPARIRAEDGGEKRATYDVSEESLVASLVASSIGNENHALPIPVDETKLVEHSEAKVPGPVPEPKVEIPPNGASAKSHSHMPIESNPVRESQVLTPHNVATEIPSNVQSVDRADESSSSLGEYIEADSEDDLEPDLVNRVLAGRQSKMKVRIDGADAALVRQVTRTSLGQSRAPKVRSRPIASPNHPRGHRASSPNPTSPVTSSVMDTRVAEPLREARSMPPGSPNPTPTVKSAPEQDPRRTQKPPSSRFKQAASNAKPRPRKFESTAPIMEAGDSIGEGDSYIVNDILSADHSGTVFEMLKREVAWRNMFHRGGEVPRMVAVQGVVDSDGSFPIYRHPADESPPLLPFTPTVELIRRRVEEVLSHPVNHVLIQHYRDGNDYISEHSDKTLDIARDSKIVNVSLGALRTMSIRRKREPDGPPVPSDQEGPKRKMQRIPMPHNSMFVLGLVTNQHWLHCIKQDRRSANLKSAAELSHSGERISLTFRHISTFLSADHGRIYGQGAVSKTKSSARPTLNGPCPEAELMLKGFGDENQRGLNFDWQEAYGSGFDVLHFSQPLPKIVSGDEADIPTARIKLLFHEKNIAHRYENIRGHSLVFIDTDREQTTLTNSIAIMQYVEQFFSNEPWLLPDPTTERAAYAASLEKLQNAELLYQAWKRGDRENVDEEVDRWEDLITSGKLSLEEVSLLHLALLPAFLEMEDSGWEFGDAVKGWVEGMRSRDCVKKTYPQGPT